MKNINVAIFGLGNCACSLIQAIYAAKSGVKIHGLESPTINGFGIENLDIVAAYDVSDTKIGLDIAEAIWAEPNNSSRFFDVSERDVFVSAGVLQEGLTGPLRERICISPKVEDQSKTAILRELNEKSVDVAVCYLPTGSTKDVQFYAEVCLEANVAFINACPERVAHDPVISKKFFEKGIPLLGDDMRSHVGATAIHTALLDFLNQRNIRIDDTYQLNIGGNSDFLNLSDPVRSNSKKGTKKAALFASGLPKDKEILAGPNGYAPFLNDRKIAFINIVGTSVLGMNLEIDLKLSVEDSPNVVSIIVDAVRLAYSGKVHGANYESALAHLFKNPPTGKSHEIAKRDYNSLILGLDATENFA